MQNEPGSTTHDAPSGSTRRGLFKAAAGAAALAGAAGVAAAPAASASVQPGERGIPVRRRSIQLYTVRNILNADVDLTLRTIREIGYRNVETAGAPAGLSVAQFRDKLDEYGLKATSAHIGIPQPFDEDAWKQSLADARTLGATYVNHPFFGQGANGPIREAAAYEQLAKDLNRAGELANAARVQMGYHNHHAEYFRMNDGSGRTGMDILFADTHEDLVHFELDLFWTYRGAADPVDIVRANPGRIRQFHVKDINANATFEDAGQGLADFDRVFRTAGRAGLVEFIVERDDAGSAPRTPEQALDTARVGFEFLEAFRF